MAINDYDSYHSSVLVLCIAGFGFVHRRITGFETKRWAGTLFGLIISYFVMGDHFWQHVIIVSVAIKLLLVVGWHIGTIHLNCIQVACSPRPCIKVNQFGANWLTFIHGLNTAAISIIVLRRKCHVFSMYFMFIYILTFRLLTMNMWYFKHVNMGLSQMLVILKIIGVAYDIHLSNKNKESKIKDNDKKETLEVNEEPLKPDFMDLFHYVFSYIGMITAPHIRYRTYDDFLRLPFPENDFEARKRVLYQNLPLVYLSIAGLKLINAYFPIEYIVTEDFRRSHFIYKNVLNFLYVLRFKLWMTSGLLMGRVICAITGLGAYPVQAKSFSAHGPRIDYAQLRNISPVEATKLDYDFETVRTLNLVQIHLSPWQSTYWRNWNMSVQYFMARYIYREAFKNTVFKDYRIVLTMLVSAFWHGLEPGYYTSLPLCGMFIVSEKSYHKIYQYTTGWVSKAYLLAMWLIQAHIFSHLMVSFVILEPNALLTHASAMNYVPYFSLLFHYLFGKVVLAYLQKNKLN